MTTAAVQSLVIEGWLPRPAMNIGHRHWSVRHRAVKAEKETVWAYAKHAGWTFVPGKVRLTIVFVHPVRRARDPDNLHARAKSTVDALKGFSLRQKVGATTIEHEYPGYFTDDSTEWLELKVDTRVERGRTALEIRLESVG